MEDVEHILLFSMLLCWKRRPMMRELRFVLHACMAMAARMHARMAACMALTSEYVSMLHGKLRSEHMHGTCTAATCTGQLVGSLAQPLQQGAESSWHGHGCATLYDLAPIATTAPHDLMHLTSSSPCSRAMSLVWMGPRVDRHATIWFPHTMTRRARSNSAPCHSGPCLSVFIRLQHCTSCVWIHQGPSTARTAVSIGAEGARNSCPFILRV